jgi:hypothetical protein
LIEKDLNRNPAHLLKCGLKLALIYKEPEDFNKCKAQCESILNLSEDIELSENELDVISKTRELMEECSNHQ